MILLGFDFEALGMVASLLVRRSVKKDVGMLILVKDWVLIWWVLSSLNLDEIGFGDERYC